jgi:nitric oxide reductase subunit C
MNPAELAMLSKSAARAFFLTGTVLCSGTFIALTIDTFNRIPEQTNAAAITPAVTRGKVLWEENNCMGCHTLFGEGAYYAPELTRVYERRGPAFIGAMLKDPEAMYPGKRKMVNYGFSDEQISDLVAFFQWCNGVNLNGFPPKPDLMPVALTAGGVAATADRPQIFNQMCVACHSLGGQGGVVGPALDGVGKRLSAADIRLRLKDPLAAKADSKMPKLPLTDSQIDELVAFLSLKGN